MAYFLHLGAVITCMHGGQAQPTASFPRVTLNKQPVVTQIGPHTIAGCALVPEAGGPCVTAQWVKAALRVKVGNMPVLLTDSSAVCANSGTGVNQIQAQMRVKGL